MDTHALENVREHDGETRDGAHDQLAWNKEIIDANACHKHAEGHDQQFHPELFADQCLANFFENIIYFAHK